MKLVKLVRVLAALVASAFALTGEAKITGPPAAGAGTYAQTGGAGGYWKRPEPTSNALKKDAGNALSAAIPGVNPVWDYCFAVSAYNARKEGFSSRTGCPVPETPGGAEVAVTVP